MIAVSDIPDLARRGAALILDLRARGLLLPWRVLQWAGCTLLLVSTFLAAGVPAALASEASGMNVPAQEHVPGVGKTLVPVGIYVLKVPELDIRTNSYLADFYLWFRWPKDAGFDPTQTFEFTNAVESWDFYREALYVDALGAPRPELMPDGSLYQVFRIQGRFQNPFDLRDYPFDRQVVRIELEDSESVVDDMEYVWDRDGQLFQAPLTIPGWTVAGASVDIDRVRYQTNFGDRRSSGGHDTYSLFRFSLDVERPLVGYLVKTVLPISVVMLITFVVFFIELRYFEGRIGLAITGLISAVALQLTSASELPNVGYMVLLDKIYNLSYFVIFIALAESVIAVKMNDAGKVLQAKRLDSVGFWICVVVFFGGSALVTVAR